MAVPLEEAQEAAGRRTVKVQAVLHSHLAMDNHHHEVELRPIRVVVAVRLPQQDSGSVVSATITGEV